ncbi:MAG: c-type cytochrome, partial [Myxococcota bacterium]|nr:c-type cytochrome [Myxococcota bacterium]
GAAPLLPRRHSFDAARAERGRDALFRARGAEMPLDALRNLWVVWGVLGLDDARYWAAFATRYGFVPREGSLYPWGVVVEGASASIQCMACHVDEVAGRAVIGAGNGRIELSELYEDLVRLAELAPSFGIPAPVIPELWHRAYADRTGAPGATDALGMGMTLASAYDAGATIETRFGFQQPPAWWQLPYADRAYTDGFAPADNFRTMLATSLASGATLDQLRAMEPAFEDMRHYLLSLSSPAWPFAAAATIEVERGRAVFARECASCHGTYDRSAGAYHDVIADVGTDPVRHQRFTTTEATWLNATWFGEPPVADTDGYLAPPLLGVWATAPYLHNGSVPDLRALLRPAERPARWRRLERGADDYDPIRVGVRFELAAATDAGVYDTTREGLSAAGHELGGGVSDGELDALLAYLTTL